VRTFKVKIRLGSIHDRGLNGSKEVARILRHLADNIEERQFTPDATREFWSLRDSRGQSVGMAQTFEE
jgi:hypothetical protein